MGVLHPVTAASVGVILGVALTGFFEVLPLLELWWAMAVMGALAVSVRCAPLFLLVGLPLGQLIVGSLPQGELLRGQVVVQGRVVAAAQGRTVDVVVARWAEPGSDFVEGRGRLRARFRERPPAPGTVVLLYGRADAPSGGPFPVLPGAPDPVRSARLARIHTELSVDRWRPVGPTPEPRAPPDRTGVLTAVATGDRSGVAPETLKRLRDTGTAHLLAISGFHVGVVAGAVGGGAAALLRWGAVLLPAGLPTGLAWVVGVGTAVLYAWGAGAPVSAQRAAGLLALAAVGRTTGRRVEILPLLGLVAVAVLIADPPALASPSMQLSFGAIVGLVRVTPVLTRWIPPDLPTAVDWAARGMATSIAATVGTLPAAAWWFQDLAPWSPLANLVAIPWFGCVVVPLAAAATWGPASVVPWAAAVGDASVELLLGVLALFAVEPWHPAVGPVGAILLVGCLMWPGRPVTCAVLLAVALGLRPVVVRPSLTFLDVGQGDAVLVEFPDGRRWLVDGGPPGGAVLQWLRRNGVRRLDVVVATHGQRDHTGGLLPVLEGLAVGELWYADPLGMEELVVRAAELGIPGRLLPSEALHPPPGMHPLNPNDASLVLRVEAGTSALLAADAEREAEEQLVGQVETAEVLKVGHHGGATSTNEAFLRAISPRVAVISAGRGNRYGHPHPAIVDRLRNAGATVWRTDLHGTIHVVLDEHEVRVRARAPGQPWSKVARYPAAGSDSRSSLSSATTK